jgi:hypothetical protein
MIGCGATRTWIARRAQERFIIREGPSAYRMAGVRRTFETRAMAAVLSARGSALVSHTSAAYLHGFERVLEPIRVEITVPRHRRPRHRTGIKVHESLAFDLAEPAVRQGIPITGAARTILDCAPTGAGLPKPVFEYPVVVDGHEYYLDLAWPDRMVAVECNDAGSHDTPKAFRRDPMKRNRCEAAGWVYLEFTWWDMVDNAAEVVALIAAALAQAA